MVDTVPTCELDIGLMTQLLAADMTHHWCVQETAMSLSTGMLLGYIAYDCTHYYLHHSSLKAGVLKRLKAAHMSHHYKDYDSGYGISSRLFDIMLNTSAL